MSSNSSSRAASTKPYQPTSTPQPQQKQAPSQSLFEADDDDPFGLGPISRPPPRPRQQEPPQDDDDNVLGLLGKPVEQVPRPQKSRPAEREGHAAPVSGINDPRDKAIAELVDMGFDPDRSRMALDQTSNGIDVQAAVGWLLTTAHEEARSRSRAQNGEASTRQPAQGQRHDRRQDEGRSGSRGPAWLRQPDGPERADSRSPATVEKDVAQYASQFGTQVWRSANTLWKTGKKNVQKAVADFQQDDDGSKPRWMQEAEMREREERVNGKAKQQEVTDEAAMLEPGRAPPRQPDSRRRRDPDLPPQQARRPAQEPSSARPVTKPAQKLSRQAVEEESMQAYVSPARRKKATPAPAPPPENHPPQPAPSEPTETFDIFSDMPAAPPSMRVPSSTSRMNGGSNTSKPSTPVPVRLKAAPRSNPQVSPTALQTSTKHRQAGTASYKIGDYAAATSSYIAALQPLPPTHPLTILLHANLALTHLKTGDAKSAVASANTALETIGSTRGEGESIDLGPSEGVRDMKDLYGKSLTRKGEALEHLERWSDAASTWREAIAVGAGGAVAMRGRERCEKAAGSSSSAAVTVSGSRSQARPATKKPAARPKPSVTKDLANQPPSEAIVRLRAANAAAASASDEAFALNDAVTARIEGWKSGKEGNLRALLASLDTVLWEGAHWTKVGMGDLVLPGRCKVVYMKAIGRVHPDKVCFLFSSGGVW